MAGIAFGQDQGIVALFGDELRKISKECPPQQSFFRSSHDDQILRLDFGQDSLLDPMGLFYDNLIALRSDLLSEFLEIRIIPLSYPLEVIVVSRVKKNQRGV